MTLLDDRPLPIDAVAPAVPAVPKLSWDLSSVVVDTPAERHRHRVATWAKRALLLALLFAAPVAIGLVLYFIGMPFASASGGCGGG